MARSLDFISMQSEAIGLLQTGELQAPFLSKNYTDQMRCVGQGLKRREP